MNKVINYFKSSLEELKKVTWPTRPQALRSTAIVIVMSVGIAVFLGVLDYIFTFAFQYFLKSR